MVCQNLFSMHFLAALKENVAPILKNSFYVPVEIHEGDIIFNLYHKKKYLFLMEIILDMDIMENIM